MKVRTVIVAILVAVLLLLNGLNRLVAQIPSPSASPSLAGPNPSPSPKTASIPSPAAASAGPSAISSPTPTAAQATPKPYSAGEFPDWANRLRRFEIVSLGTFPFTFLAAGLLYDIGRWGVKAISKDPRAGDYAPLFFGGPNKPALTIDDSLVMLGIALGLSLTIGLIDLLLQDGKPIPTPIDE